MSRRNGMQHVDFVQGGDERFLPCPFCGVYQDEEGHSFDILFDYWYKIRCNSCSCMPYSSASDTVEKAIEFWNKRVRLASIDDAKFLISRAIHDLERVLSEEDTA